MNISRFFGSTSREAMRQVRMALGPDAMIVSNRRVNGGVEIMATDATSVESATAVATAQEPTRTQSAPQRPVSAAPTSTGSQNRAPEPSPRAELMGAIGAMQGALESRIDELLWSHQLQRTPETIALFQTLLAYGFSTTLLRAMLKRLPSHLTGRRAFEWARNELDTHLPVVANEDLLWQPGTALALVGPTGVGKTTTIAKLAARCVKRFGPDKLVLITTDTYRIGAHEQLKIYADILRVPVHVVQDAQALRQVMLGIRPEQVVLIDNVGISQRDRYVGDQATLLASSGRRVQRLLALNASSHGDTLDEVARVYKTDGGSPLIGCIITKVDEASRIGPALDTAIRYQLPIHYISNGQKVPEHLQFLTAKQLVDMAFTKISSNAKALYAPTAGDVAALLSAAMPEQTESSSVDDTQRTAMMTKLLLSNSTSAAMSVDELRTQIASIDQCLSLSSAFDYWRDLQIEGAEAANLLQQGEDLLRDVKHELSEEAQRPLLCVHQVASTPKSNQGSARVATTYLCGTNGSIYSVPYQQIAAESEWQSTSGAHRLTHRNNAELTKESLSWVGESLAGRELIHAFDGGNAAFWRELVAAQTAFLSTVPASLKLWHKDGHTTPKALSKQVAFQAITSAESNLHYTKVAGLAKSDLGVWLAVEPIELRTRNLPVLSLKLVCLRLIDRNTHHVVRDHFAVMHTPASSASFANVADWMVAQSELKVAQRAVSAAWALSAQWAGQSSLSVAEQARMTTLLSAATTNVLLMADKAALLAALEQLSHSGRATALSVPKTIEAFIKLFMLKNVLE